MTSIPDDLAQQRFLRDWSAFIEGWVNKVVFARGGSRDETRDLRQAAYLAAWTAYLEWQELPEDEQTELAARMIVSRSVKDATAREARQRGSGSRARLLRATLGQLGSPGVGYGRTILEAQSRALVDYHVHTEGLVHGQHGLVRQDTQMLRDEIKERLDFAVERLRPELRELILAIYFEGLSIRAIAQRSGLSRSHLSRLHREAIDLIREEIIEFASVLSARNLGHTLDDVPTGGDAPT